MYIFLAILAVLVCILLILIVLVQNPKGGGLSSQFGGGNQVMGVKRTTDFLEKATWALALALLILCVGMNLTTPGSADTKEQKSAIQEQIDASQPAQQAAPVASPSATPAQQDSTKK